MSSKCEKNLCKQDSIETVFVSLPSSESSPTCYKSASSGHSNDKSLVWRKSMLALGDSIEPQEKSKAVTKKRYILVSEHSKIDLLHGGPNDSLVSVTDERQSKAPGAAVLRRPLYAFVESVNWKQASRIVMSDLRKDGVYFASILWRLKHPYQLVNGSPLKAEKPSILHCICREPENRFQGRIGPISTFIPHETRDKKIGGIWVSLFSDQIYAEFIEQLTPFSAEYRMKLKQAHQTNEQVMFFVAHDGACVGIQVLNTKKEEKQIKQSKQVYHHERPLILEDGFYLVEGMFETKFLNTGQEKSKLHLDCNSGPKIVIIGEGSHLIRTQTQPSPNLDSDKPKRGRKNRRDRKAQLQNHSPSGPSSDFEWSQASRTLPEMSECNSPGAAVDRGKAVMASTDPSEELVRGKMGKIRRVEVCLDSHYERVIALEHTVLQQDFHLNLDAMCD